MVDQKAVRLLLHFAVPAQTLADRLAFLAGIRKDETFFSPRVFKDVANAGIGVPGRCVCRFFRRKCSRLFRKKCSRLFPAFFTCLRRGIEKMLHGEPPGLFSPLNARNDSLPAAACSQKLSCGFRVPDGGGQADPSRTAACEGAETLYQAEGLQAPVSPQERMDLINDDEAEIPEEGRDFHVLVDHQ